MSYDDSSNDAMFSRIMTRLDQQDADRRALHAETKEQLRLIVEQTTKTNGRVRELESWRDLQTGRVVGAAMVISGAITLLGLIANYLLLFKK